MDYNEIENTLDRGDTNMNTKEQMEYAKSKLSSEEEIKEYLYYQQNPVSEKELRTVIKEAIEKELNFVCFTQDEERVKQITSDMKEEMIELTLFYYKDQNRTAYLDPLLPITRAHCFVQEGIIPIFYNQSYLKERIEACFKTIFLLRTELPFLRVKREMLIYVEDQVESLGTDFYEPCIPWAMKEFFFAILAEKYHEKIEFVGHPTIPLEWLKELTETERKIFRHLTNIIDTHRGGWFETNFSQLPKKIITDIASSISVENPNEHIIHDTVSDFVIQTFLEKYPEDKPESELVSEVLEEYQGSKMMTVEEAYQVPSSLQKMIVNYLISIFPLTKEQTWEIPVRLLQDIELLCKKQLKSHMPNEVNKWCLLFLQNRLPQLMENNEILIVNYPKQLTIGEVVNTSLQYSANGYPHVLGFVGNQLFVSSKEIEVDLQTLQEIQKDDSTVISVVSEDELSIFKIKRR